VSDRARRGIVRRSKEEEYGAIVQGEVSEEEYCEKKLGEGVSKEEEEEEEK